VFSQDYKDLKGLVQKMGETKIELIPGETPIKKRPYKLTHKCKLIIQKEIDGMLGTCIIYPIDKSEWESPMVVQPKKHKPKKIRIYIDFRGLKKMTLKDPFPTPFVNEIINKVTGHEC
jgi:hypothetical protein